MTNAQVCAVVLTVYALLNACGTVVCPMLFSPQQAIIRTDMAHVCKLPSATNATEANEDGESV